MCVAPPMSLHTPLFASAPREVDLVGLLPPWEIGPKGESYATEAYSSLE